MSSLYPRHNLESTPGPEPRGDHGCKGSGERPLVSSPISQSSEFHLYHSDLKVKRPFTGEKPVPPVRSGSQLQGFSDKSRSRLRFTARNAGHKTITQFCMTYGDVWPVNGRSLKADLNRFLTRVRQVFPNVCYIWVAEFQTRGCPHFHFYSSIPLNVENHDTLTRIWHKIAGYGQDKHLRVHGHTSNFISWNMGSGAYLCKYLDKLHQKCIPEGFTSFGRWWGNSRGIVEAPETITAEELAMELDQDTVDLSTGEITEYRPLTKILRIVGKHHEKVNRKSWFRKTSKSTSAPYGAPIFLQALEYFRKVGPPPEPSPF